MKICVATGTRADYSLLFPLISLINKSSDHILQLVVTGNHLSEKFGFTVREIEKDGFKIERKIDLCINGDSELATSNYIANGIIGFANAINDLQPDLIVVLGDRYEMLSIAIPSCINNIPLAHIHGGERTEGVIDEAIRHSITKFSHIHFVSCEEYRKRVIQLGENSKNVFNVGAPFIDNISAEKFIPKYRLYKSIGLNINRQTIVACYHPLTLDSSRSSSELSAMLKALRLFKDKNIVFSSPNADPGNSEVHKKILQFTMSNQNATLISSLGRLRYYSLLSHASLMIGNSSSGIIETPVFKLPTINIGDRQKGRLIADNIINTKGDEKEIIKAIEIALGEENKKKIITMINPYGDKGVARRILTNIEKIDLKNILKKSFQDLK